MRRPPPQSAIRIPQTDESLLDPVERERALMARTTPPDANIDVADVRPRMVDGRWTFLGKLALILCAGLVIGYLFIWIKAVQDAGGPECYIRGTSDRGPVDFVSTLTGALILRDGDGTLLYDLNTQHDAQNLVLAPCSTLPAGRLLPYNHLPIEAMAIAPFMNLPFPLIFALWTMLAGLAIGLSLGLMDGALPMARPVGWVMSMAACSYLPIIRGLMLGQNSPLVLLGLCGTYVALKRGREPWAGAALLLVALKPQVLPVVLLLMLLQRYWRAVLTFVLLLAGLSILAMPVLGPGWPFSYLQLIVGVAGWNDAGAINPAIMHNWRGFATDLFGNIAPALVTPVYIGLTVLSGALLVWVWSRSRDSVPSDAAVSEDDGAEGERRGANWDLLWALAGVVAVLVSPHLNPHDLTLLIFPAWIIGTHALLTARPRWLHIAWLAILWSAYFLAPLTLYREDPAPAVIPSVMLMAITMLLLAWQIVFAKREEDAAARLVPA